MDLFGNFLTDKNQRRKSHEKSNHSKQDERLNKEFNFEEEFAEEFVGANSQYYRNGVSVRRKDGNTVTLK
ncbi:MAG: hypothetical protein MJE63_04090 [Proteobacteria bacterium]|nr:hypothetical protein [Pseudomonadota bacterium]